MSDLATERAERVRVLAETILKGTAAMERNDWPECQRMLAEGARQSRVLDLLARQADAAN